MKFLLKQLHSCAQFIALIVFLGSCSPYFYQPFGDRDASLGPETKMKKELLSLPAPKEPVVVAVYKFRDQTGQYKESNVGASWSTAVTQGATNILIRALEESGWFVPIERENISNLLNERKIIRSSREQYEGNNNILLPPLLFAGVLLEGGIVSYETNVFTGGAGIRYFGSNVSSQYREDRVSIYLRAVSTSNGKVLKTVYTTKSILSQEVSTGIFRYVKFKRLLEAEMGYTHNEPRELAITEAVEKAVHSLVIEGIIGRLWELNEPIDSAQHIIDDYLEEKENNREIDYMGQPHIYQSRSGFYLNPMLTSQNYLGDYPSSEIRGGINYSIGVGINKSFYFEPSIGYQYVNIRDLVNSSEFYGDANLVFLANPTGKLSPLFSIGAGSYYNFGNEISLSQNQFLPYVTYGAGFEYLVSSKSALTFKAYLNQHLSDNYDGVGAGSFDDVIVGARFGLKIYLGN
ncbi:curli production assembly/transport component CsgG [Cyclobacterium lianum]|uniref:Curli production assembly/transport component CsgG n=1 Tax=Cyclobacterium lianum TaxID=388280 RepID=A0A1M7PD87_9BACT|nr:CsgG/HfaB family protein [Cyclobacterium lianum]SHN14548.1 curli production assembly/transport component CsgG [Cyclobacterium lianum]